MATKQIVMQQMQRLSRHHPQYKLTPEMLDDYYSVLNVCLPEYLETGVQNLLATSKYFPKPAEVLQAHETAMLQALEMKNGAGNANRLMEVK